MPLGNFLGVVPEATAVGVLDSFSRVSSAIFDSPYSTARECKMNCEASVELQLCNAPANANAARLRSLGNCLVLV